MLESVHLNLSQKLTFNYLLVLTDLASIFSFYLDLINCMEYCICLVLGFFSLVGGKGWAGGGGAHMTFGYCFKFQPLWC
jgi:hypothetical protein